MCGLVLAMGKTTLTQAEIGIFKNMLAFDQLRGDHSTGLFALFRPYNKQPFYKVNKDCMEGVDFVRSPLFVNTVGHVSQLAGGLKSTEWAKAMFGHNRYATMGAVNARNAHPFTHGKITLAHNGTLRNQSLLPDSEKFQVDSENICYAIDKIGIDETVKLLNGAFTLIWFNSEEMTINILRNTEREFHLFETANGDWYGCSEEKMGDWLLTRGKTGKTIKRHFELTPGVQYVFDVSKGCELKEERKHELPVFRSAYYPQTRQAWKDEDEAYDQWYEGRHQRNARSATDSKGSTKPKETAEASSRLENLKKKFRVKEGVGDLIEYEMYSFEPYISESGEVQETGQVIGWFDNQEMGEYMEIQTHGIKKSDFTVNTKGYGEVIAMFERNDCLHYLTKVVGENIYTKPVVINHSKILQGETANGRQFTREEWESMKTKCPTCDMHFTYEKMHECDFIAGYALCKDDDACEARVRQNDLEDKDLSFLDELDDGILDDIKVTATGEQFTSDEWRKSRHNSCSGCGNPIMYEDVPDVKVVNSYAFCGDCVEELEKMDKKDANEGVGDKRPDSPAGQFCTACGEFHGMDILDGTMTYATFKGLSSTCYWKAIHRHKFTTEQLAEVVEKKPHGWCEVCGETHSVYIRTGNMALETWNKLKVSCPVKIKFKEKFAPGAKSNVVPINKVTAVQIPTKTVDVLVPCQACGQEFLEDQLEGGMCSHCRTRFQGCTPITRKPRIEAVNAVSPAPVVIESPVDLQWFEDNVCPTCGWKHSEKFTRGMIPVSQYEEEYAQRQCAVAEYWIGKKKPRRPVLSLAKTVKLPTTPPMTVTPSLWENMNTCRKCSDKIPFDHIGSITFWGNAPVCIDCSLDQQINKDK